MVALPLRILGVAVLGLASCSPRGAASHGTDKHASSSPPAAVPSAHTPAHLPQPSGGLTVGVNVANPYKGSVAQQDATLEQLKAAGVKFIRVGIGHEGTVDFVERAPRRGRSRSQPLEPLATGARVESPPGGDSSTPLRCAPAPVDAMNSGPSLRSPFRCTVGVLVVSLLAACSHPRTTLGGFEGRILMHTKEAAGAESDFTLTAKGGFLRVDMPPAKAAKPGEVTLGHSVYVHATNRVRLFFDSTKEFREMDLSSRIAAEDAGPGAPALEKKGSRQTLAGLPCDDASVKTPDGGHTDVCLAKGLAYLEMFRVHMGPHGTESSLAREYREHSTFPLEMVEYDAEGKERARMQVTKIERASVSDDAFDLPAGYTKVDPHFDTPPRGSGTPGQPAQRRPH